MLGCCWGVNPEARRADPNPAGSTRVEGGASRLLRASLISTRWQFEIGVCANHGIDLGRGRAALSSVFFGLGHFFGHPSGVRGAILATLAGAVLGETMLGTGSVLPSWLVHVLLDVIIFMIVARQSSR
jgi:Type II CAAX prenyl endopeptidase Rce1-like